MSTSTRRVLTSPSRLGSVQWPVVAVIACVAVASRIGLLLLGELWLALPVQEHVPLGRFVDPTSGQLERLGLSDPVLYRSIMEDGYERRPFTDDRQANWAFLPAWPLLWRAAATLVPVAAAAVLVNTVLFATGCVLVFLLVRDHLGERAASLAAALLLVAPGAQFTVRPGPESLFLAASAGTLLLAQRGRWWLVAPVVSIAALTRPQGVLLLLPLAMIALHQWQQARAGRGAAVPLPLVGLALLAPLASVAGFCAHLGRLTGNPLATVDIQRAWDNESAWPGLAVVRSAKTLLVDRELTDYYGFNLIPLSLAVIGLAVWLLVAGVRHRLVPAPLLAYTAVSLLLLLTRSQTQAALRYLLVLFPLYAVAAAQLEGRRRLRLVLLPTLLALQVVMHLAALHGAEWALT